jgi:hypothetical protein
MNIPRDRNIAFKINTKKQLSIFLDLYFFTEKERKDLRSIYVDLDKDSLRNKLGWVYYYSPNAKNIFKTINNFGFDNFYSHSGSGLEIDPCKDYPDMNYFIVDINNFMREQKLERILNEK